MVLGPAEALICHRAVSRELHWRGCDGLLNGRDSNPSRLAHKKRQGVLKLSWDSLCRLKIDDPTLILIECCAQLVAMAFQRGSQGIAECRLNVTTRYVAAR